MIVDDVKRGDVLTLSDERWLVRDVGRAPGRVLLKLAETTLDPGDWFGFLTGQRVRVERPNER